MSVAQTKSELTLGPGLFNWAPEVWRDFYFRIADEAPVSTVYLGEAICSKRAPLFEPHLADVSERLTKAGKTVVYSTLSEVMSKLDRDLVESVCAAEGLVEANDGSALYYLHGRPHHVGSFINAYNERSLAVLVRNGATNICLPPEMPATAIGVLAPAAAKLGVMTEVQVFGRVGLAVSARCYHARAHGRVKDTCRFVCEEDPDGMVLRTLENTPFLTVNGIQTMSHDYLNLIGELAELEELGVRRFRLSPHSCDMVEVAETFHAVLTGGLEAAQGTERLKALNLGAPFSNGFYHHTAGYRQVPPGLH